MDHDPGGPPPTTEPPPPRHTIALTPSPRMDASSLMSAVCTCGAYRSGPDSTLGAATSGRQHVAAATVNDAAPILTAGLAWLIDTVQPGGVLTTQHGVARSTRDRWFRFVPSPTWPIIVMQTHPVHGERDNLLNSHDVKALHADLIRRGHLIRSTWNGASCETVSVALGGAVHPTLLDAVETYHRGCPEHGEVFCSPRRNGCRWYDNGNRGLILPGWTEGDR